MGKQLAVREQKELTVPIHEAAELSLAEGLAHVERIQAIMRAHFREGFHFGTIPGTAAPTLYRRGAEFLCRQFRLRASFQLRRRERPGGHFVWESKCVLINKATRQIEGEGIGHASSMEVKYRYRRGPKGERIENADIENEDHTIKMIAKKRSYVDAVFMTTAAGEIFIPPSDDDDDQMASQNARGEPHKAATQSVGASATTAEKSEPKSFKAALWEALLESYDGNRVPTELKRLTGKNSISELSEEEARGALLCLEENEKA
jgi:hypothetical protein